MDDDPPDVNDSLERAGRTAGIFEPSFAILITVLPAMRPQCCVIPKV